MTGMCLVPAYQSHLSVGYWDPFLGGVSRKSVLSVCDLSMLAG
jgi:hypothetical protein